MTLTVGSLCTGYDGIGLALDAMFPNRRLWFSEIDKGACKILAHHWPDVPNLGDLTAVDWSQVESPDILTAGYPCQPFSQAGKGLGTDDPRHIFPWIAEAIRVLRPRIVLLENVRGHLRLGFDAVQGFLAGLGYDVRWVCIRASDVGAPHRRERIFIVATDPGSEHLLERWQSAPGQASSGALGEPAGRGGTRPASDAGGIGGHEALEHHGDCATISDGASVLDECHRGHHGTRPNRLAADTAGDGWHEGRAESARLIGGSDAAERGSSVADTDSGRREVIGRELGIGHHLDRRSSADIAWGKYESAIRRWERITRPAPRPTEPNTRGNERLSPRLSEWMMGLPAGHVTDVPDLGRNEQLKAIGNGVCPQQAAAAYSWLLASLERAA